MATVRANPITPIFRPHTHKFQIHPFPSLFAHKPKPHKISCTQTPNNDSTILSELSSQISKINTQTEQSKEAIKKGRELVFTELCKHLGLKKEEVGTQWRGIREEEKRDLAKGFVSNWGSDFHPLSAKSVVEIVDEYLLQFHLDLLEVESSGSRFVLLNGLKRLMGFSLD